MKTPTRRTWMTVAAVYAVAVGLALIAIALWPAALHFDRAAALAFWPNVERAGGPTGVARLALAVSGALTAAIGVLAWSLSPLWRGGGRPAALAGRAVRDTLIVWFVLDSAASILVGAPMNAVGNLTLLAAMLPPAISYARAA